MRLQEQLSKLKSAALTVPDTSGVSEAFALVDTGSPFAELFFTTIADPAWLNLLERKGYFSSDSAGPAADHRTEHRRRLPFFALARFADTKPQLVAGILLRMSRESIASRSDEVLRCLASIKDRKAIVSLRPLVVDLAESPHNSTSVWFEEILKTWTAAGAHIEAKAVLRAFIISTVRSSSEQRTRLDNHWQIGEIDEKLVSVLARDCPQDIASIYFEALSRWAALRRAGHDLYGNPDESDPAQDLPPVYWLQDFKQPSRDSRDLEETLTIRLYHTCAQIYAGTNQQQIAHLDALLRSDRWELFNRLRWQLYADHPATTLAMARTEIFDVMDLLGRIDYGHPYEFAQMLTNQTALHGAKFLSPAEVEKLTATVMAGPLDRSGAKTKDTDEQRFWQRQLQPIEPLLSAKVRESVQPKGLPLEAYKPIQGGFARMIEQVSPYDVAAMGAMSNEELWSAVNSWKSKRREGDEWWIEESSQAFADQFALLVEKEPGRFPFKNEWWRQISRPIFANRFLERAVSRLSTESYSANPPTDAEWSNWLGVSNWIVAKPESPEAAADDNASDWSRHSAARFLKAAVGSAGGGSAERFTEIKRQLRLLLSARDARADREIGPTGDWLTVAINSTRGDAVEALLDIALRQTRTKLPIDDWIFPEIRARLEAPDDSPAIFALLGSRLRLVLYLFESQFRAAPELLFPPTRSAHRDAVVLAHFQYDNPASSVIAAFPKLICLGLDQLEKAIQDKESEKTGRRDFAPRLGMHIAFYYWNNAFARDGEETLDRFFKIAPAGARSSVVEQIASAFDAEKPDQVPPELWRRAMQIWDRRFGQLVAGGSRPEESVADAQGELAAFTDWICCECFPFEWRVRMVVSALNLLSAGPRPYRLTRYLGTQADKPERQLDLLRVLEALIRKNSDDVRWAVQEKEIRPLLENAFKSKNPEVLQQADATLEVLLRQGFLMFLDIGQGTKTKTPGG